MPKRYTAAKAAADAQRVIDKRLGRPAAGACQCRNHLGRPKTQHKSKDAALAAILRRHLRHAGACTTYPCPTKTGVFHVATKRKKHP